MNTDDRSGDLERLIADPQHLLDQATPGPWKASEVWTEDDEIEAICIGNPETLDVVVAEVDKWWGKPDPNSLATANQNAALIAAAPGLLAQLLDVARQHQKVVAAIDAHHEAHHDVEPIWPCCDADRDLWRTVWAVGEVPTTGGQSDG